MGWKESRYTLEEKLFSEISLVQDGQSVESIRRQYGVHDSQIQQWLERYEAGGVSGLKKRHIQQTYSQKFKLEIIQKYLEGCTSYPKLAREFGIPSSSVIVQWE